MGQPGCYECPDRSQGCEIPGEPNEILICKTCPLTDCVRHGETGFCAMTSSGKGTGYYKRKER